MGGVLMVLQQTQWHRQSVHMAGRIHRVPVQMRNVKTIYQVLVKLKKYILPKLPAVNMQAVAMCT